MMREYPWFRNILDQFIMEPQILRLHVTRHPEMNIFFQPYIAIRGMQNQGKSVKLQRCQIQNFKNDNFFSLTAKLVERYCKKCHNNPSGNSLILLNSTQT